MVSKSTEPTAAESLGENGLGEPRSLHLLGAGPVSCGIGDFAGLLLQTFRRGAPNAHKGMTLVPGGLPLAQIWHAMGAVDAVVANFPVVAWKRALFGPVAVFALAAMRGRGRVTILHEWGGLHRLRRLALRPILVLSDTIVFVSPQVRAELAADPLVGMLAARAALMPLPPNLARPAATAGSVLRDRLIAARGDGRLVLGHFGSIYPGKQPEAMLDIAAALKLRGARPLLVFVGAFIKAFDGIEDTFRRKVADLGLTDDVLVTGYVASAEELYGLFEAVHVFAYVLPDGLTARRASVLACVQAGRPVIVTAPIRSDEFDHHPRFRTLLDGGAIVLAPPEAGPEDYADLILAARNRPMAIPDLNMAAWFGDAAASLKALMPARGSGARPR